MRSRDERLAVVDAWWRAANYCAVGQIYLRDNPLLREPLLPEHVKTVLLGHWGTTPGQNFIYAHLNRVIRERRLNMIYVSGPGHGGPALIANSYLEGGYSEVHTDVTQDLAGLRRLFQQFSFPGGVPSHVSPDIPGSIHEGGELGYSLSHAFGAAFDNPELIVACVIGDGEAETGPLSAAWASHRFLNPETDGAVLPILHLNGYKIANPTLMARMPRADLVKFLEGNGWAPHFVTCGEPSAAHRLMADTLDTVVGELQRIRAAGMASLPIRWPMIVLESPKGWTGPAFVDGMAVENSFRAHQVPLRDVATNDAHLKQLEQWLRSYQPDTLFGEHGRLFDDVRSNAPDGNWRMSANPHANGGLLLQDLELPKYSDFAVAVPAPGTTEAADTHVLGRYLREVVELNESRRNFRIVGPDETLSNGLGAVFEVTSRQWLAEIRPGDEFLAPYGRVLETLSEHQCQGWLEGYLLTGRHGLFNCYEAFVHIVDSMFNQHAKWLKVAKGLAWRRPIASLNYLLASHVWRQDHNGFTHQDPGFLDVVLNKKPDLVRVYLPPDANCLLAVADHCLRSRNRVNVIVAGKHPAPQWLTSDEATTHCARGLGMWTWASNDAGREPDVVIACAGDVPTQEALAAVSILRKSLPELSIRLVNVVDLTRLQPDTVDPHGMNDADFDALFTRDKPVIFAFHGYPWLIHRLTYRRANHTNIHVRGYNEEGTITTPFDMTVLNRLDRFHLVQDVVDRLPAWAQRAAHLKQEMQEALVRHRFYINEHGVDMPQVRDWQWAG